jgi:hypothetical protein
MKEELNAILRPVQKPPPILDPMSIQDYLKSVLPELSAEDMQPELDLLSKHKIRTIGAVRLARETFLVNLGLSEPVLGALLKVK